MLNPKIMVVEDEKIVAMEIQNILRNLRYSVPALVSSGEEAIQKASETRPDLVLMDIVLEGDMDGVEAAERMRVLFDIPVVYLTAYADKETLQRAKVTEPHGYILKPFQKKELHATIETVLHKHKLEKVLQISHRFLEIANRCAEIDSLLREFITEIRHFTGCTAVGICLLDEENKIPYQVYEGFSQDVGESEVSVLINSSSKDMFNNVIQGETDLKLPFYTRGGSFYINSAKRFSTMFSDEEKEHREQFEYNSVALFPIRQGDQILGLIYVADPKENMIPLEIVKLMEDVAMQLGTAITRLWAQEALRESEERYRKLFEESKDAVLICTSKQEVLDINPAGLELFGYSSKSEFLKIDPARDFYVNPKHLAILRKTFLKQGFVKDYELPLKKKDGQQIIVLLTASPVSNDKSAIVAYQVNIRDVTVQKRLEQQLFQTQKMASLGVMAGGVGHEINNPLAVINGAVYLLAKRCAKSDEFALKNIKIIRDAVSRASRVVDNLLHFAESESHISFELLSVNRIVEDVLSMFRNQLNLQQIKIKKHLADDLPPILGDDNQLQQVLMNLILNARSAMPKGGELTLATTHLENQVVITCADTGAGISPDDLDKIFDPFYTTRATGEGTGLGLSISYQIIQQHGGVIEAYSAGKNKGSTFTIKLPVMN